MRCRDTVSSPACLMTSGPRPPGEVEADAHCLIKQRERTKYPQLTDVPPDLRVSGARHASHESLPPSKPLSTLFYRPEASNLGDLLRLSTTWFENTANPSDFYVTSVAHRTPRKSGCSTSDLTLSPCDTFPGTSRVLMRRENSPRDNAGLFRVQLRHRKIRIQIQEY